MTRSASQESMHQSAAAMLSYKSETLNEGAAKAIIEDDGDEETLCIFDLDE
jgi:hypothetical protein